MELSIEELTMKELTEDLWRGVRNNSMETVYKVYEELTKRGLSFRDIKERFGTDGSTPVLCACENFPDIASFLISHGADISIRNYKRESCLMKAAEQKNEKFFKELLLKDGELNPEFRLDEFDIYGNTVLHHVLLKRRGNSFKFVELLMQYGVDPFIRNEIGLNALNLAGLEGHVEVVKVLAAGFKWPMEELADAFDLLGCTMLNSFGAICCWRRAIHIREESKIKKYPGARQELKEVYHFKTEFETEDELNTVTAEGYGALEVYIQCQFILERILGPSHRHSISGLFQYTLECVQTRQESCLPLFKYVLENVVEKFEFIHPSTAECLTFMQQYYMENYETANEELVQSLTFTSNFIIAHIKTWTPLLNLHPKSESQHTTLRGIMKVLFSMLEILRNFDLTLVNPLMSNIQEDVQMDTGDTFLHCLLNWLTSGMGPSVSKTRFAQEMLKAFVLSGANINAVNCRNETIVHTLGLQQCATGSELVKPLLQQILEAGIHLDIRNRNNLTVLQIMDFHGMNVNPLKYGITLKCLSAVCIKKNAIGYENRLPKLMMKFVNQH